MNSIVIVLISWAVCIALFILGVYFLTKHAVWFERNSIKFFCIAIILGLGVYLFGYYFREGADFSDQHSSEFSAANLLSSVALSFVSTGRMFMMELDIGELGVIGDVLIYRVIYGFVLLLAVFSLAIVVLSVIGGGVLSNIRLQFLRLLGSRKKFFIICGYRREILTLIQDLRKQHPKNPILLLLKREELDQMEHSEIQAIMNLGCIRSTFKNNGSGISTISTYCFPKRKCPEPICLIAASTNTSENAETARIICGALTSQPDYPNRVQLHVLVSYEESEEMMSLACPPSCDLHWSDLEELASRLLLTEYPLWYFLKDTDFSKGCLPMEIRFAVMGYSPLSVWICRNLITEMQFKGCRLKLFWLDDGIEDKAASFKYMNPKISQVADIVCINALPFGNKFFTWLQENAASFHGVFCVYGDDSVNRRTAAAFRNLLPAFQVFYRVHTSTVFDQTAHGICFGTEEQLYSETILLQESLDLLAMAIHEYYGVFYGMSRREA